MDRRSLLIGGLVGLLAAPAIVRVSSLMPVSIPRWEDPSRWNYSRYVVAGSSTIQRAEGRRWATVGVHELDGLPFAIAPRQREWFDEIRIFDRVTRTSWLARRNPDREDGNGIFLI